MPHTRRTCPRKLASWLALFAIASLLLAGFALPAAQAAPQALLTSLDQPTLVSPANEGVGEIASPALGDSVTDSASNPAAANLALDFMFVLIPDAQNESQYAPAMFTAQTNWIVSNKSTNNIVFVTTAGDMVNTSSDTTQYNNADAAIDILDTGGVWYSVAPGNHDIAYGTTYYANYFGVSRYASHLYANGGWFGGSYDDYNTYSLFSASGMDFILINLQYQPTTAIFNWADALLTTYSSRRAIVEEHDILNVNNSFVNQASYDALRDHNNLFLMLSGHMHSGSDGAAYVAGTGTGGAGQTIHIVQADYQDMSYGNGWLRLFRFSPANDTIYMTTYSPYTSGSITTSPDQMNLAYVMPDAPLALPQAPVVTSISQSGGNVTLGWDPVTADLNGGSPAIDAYRVYGSQQPYTAGTLLPPTSAAATFTHATGGANWYYLVRAHNAVGESADSAPRKGRFGFTLVPGS